jgi:hypothetical protein
MTGHRAHGAPDDEWLALLHAVHQNLTAEMTTLQCEVRERVSRIEALRCRLTDVEQAQQELAGEL